MKLRDVFWKRPFLGAMFIASFSSWVVGALVGEMFIDSTEPGDRLQLLVEGLTFVCMFAIMLNDLHRERRQKIQAIADRLSGVTTIGGTKSIGLGPLG